MTSDKPSLEATGLPRRTLDTRAKIALPLCALVLLGLAVHRLILAEPAPRPYVEFTGRTMGTTYSVKLAEEDISESRRAQIAQEIEAQLENVNALMSSYRDDSELVRFNRHASLEPFSFSAETMEVFEIARDVSEMSGGAFDITVGPLGAAWGVGATDRAPEPPSPDELRDLETRVGFKKLAYNPSKRTISKLDPRVECDLSAIAKGYGVDRVADAIRELGYESYLVEVGGELRASGRKLDGVPWRVGIERPDAEFRTSHQAITLTNTSLATSGDYRDYYEVDGQRISHTIDPRSKRPVAHALASVSVLHKQAVWADALATALNVLGPVEGLAFAEENQIPALFLVREPPDQFRSVATSAFERIR